MRSSSVSRSSSSLLPPPRQAPPRRCASPTRHFLLRDTFLRARNIENRKPVPKEREEKEDDCKEEAENLEEKDSRKENDGDNYLKKKRQR
ncbi:uncharacterized protein DS421_20g686920 [Arachis hypogaea]|nr:uncharacterized protein DS421_20g686920 [Arachis hypogaea]